MPLGILFLILTWAFYLACFCGLGLFLLRSFFPVDEYPDFILSSFWLGFSISIIILQIWHFFAPVNEITLLSISFISLVSIILNRSQLLLLIKQLTKKSFLFLIFFLVVGTGIAWQALGPVAVYDSGLYHIPTIKWISSFPVVPGLGNLYDCLAYNNSFFLVASLMGTGFWSNKSSHVVNGLLFLAIFLEAGLSSWKVLFGAKPAPPPDVMRVLLLPPLVILCKTYASSPTPDIVIFILGAVLACQWCATIYETLDNRLSSYLKFFIITISAIGITIKLNFLIYGIVLSILTFLNLGNLNSPERLFKKEYNYLILIIFWLILLPWILRHIILSGYFFYPFPYLSLPVDWKVPFETALNEYLWIKSWARGAGLPPAQVLANWHWLMPWIRNLFIDRFLVFMIVFPLGLAVLGFLCIFRKIKQTPQALLAFMVFMSPPVLSLLYWFFMAPDQRFAGVSFWYLGAGTWALASQYLGFPPRRLQVSLLLLTGLTIFLALFLYRGSLRRQVTLLPGAYGFYPLPTVEFQENFTRSGLRVFTPKNGEQCWDGPLPCAPGVQPHLQLRKSGNMASGFMISSGKTTQSQQE